MVQTVYADVLFFVNFYIDILILLSTSLIIKQKYMIWQYVLLSFTGAFLSCIAFYCSIPQWAILLSLAIIYYLLFRFIIRCKGKLLLKTIIVFFVCTICYGGGIFLLYLFTGLGSVSVFNNGALYIDIPFFVLFIFSFISFSLIWLFSKIYNFKHSKNSIVDVDLEILDRKYSLKGIIDSANTLKEPISGFPVAVCSSDTVGIVFDEIRYGVRLVPYNTVNGKGILKAFRCKISIKSNESIRIISDTYLAVSSDMYIDTDKILLPAEILELGEVRYVIQDAKNMHIAKKTVQ